MPRILFASVHPFYPESVGGAELSTLALLKRLRRRGWGVETICGLLPALEHLRSLHPLRWSARWALKRPPLFVARDDLLGFPCWRLNGPPGRFLDWLDLRLRGFRPDLVIGTPPQAAPLLRRACRQGCATAQFFHDASWSRQAAKSDGGWLQIANSPFTAQACSRITGKRLPVIFPLVEARPCRARRRTRDYITLVNAVPEKGVEVALEVARRLPGARFLMVQSGWWRHRSEPFQLPPGSPSNVEVWAVQEPIRRVYAVTDILLVPSQCEETFCRVIVEAHLNGIPVVAAQVGGIPFTVGEGGLLVSPKENVAGYVRALQRLRTDKKLYRRLSARALKNSRRPEFDAGRQLQRFLRLVEGRLR